MSEIMLDQPKYQPPEGLLELGDRSSDGKKFFLYVGDKAVVDVVAVSYINQEEQLGGLIASVESTPDKALDLFEHTALFMPEKEASRIFGRAA